MDGNRPLPSSKNPYFQNDVRCTTFLVKMSFICMRMKNDFHIKGWAPTLVLKQRPGGTRKWPILQFIVVMLNLRLNDKSTTTTTNHGLWLLSTLEMMAKCRKLTHDPQDKGFLCKVLSFPRELRGQCLNPPSPFCHGGMWLNYYDCYQGYCYQEGRNSVWQCSSCGKLLFFFGLIWALF